MHTVLRTLVQVVSDIWSELWTTTQSKGEPELNEKLLKYPPTVAPMADPLS